MPTLNGTMPYNPGDIPPAPCIWCGRPTDLRFDPAGMPHLGPQPMHLLCATALLIAYQRFLGGRILPERDAVRLRQITAHAATA